jgi:hypothetical protein
MLFRNKHLKKQILSTLFLIFTLAFFAACSADSTTNSNSETEDEHASEEHGEHEHDEGRIPNPDGAAVSILAPADGASFNVGDEVPVEVQVDNFDIGEGDNHWHVYVDGTSWGMVMGGNTTETLRGLEAGEHEIEVYIAGGDHIEFEDGDSVHITVEE